MLRSSHFSTVSRLRSSAFAVLSSRVLRGVLVVGVERVAAADDAVARRGRAVAERAADLLRVCMRAARRACRRAVPVAQHEPAEADESAQPSRTTACATCGRYSCKYV